MKKTLFIFLSLLLSGQIFAQDSKWSFSPSMGINLTSISGQYDMSPKIGFNGALMAQYRINDYIAIEAGAKFSNQNTKFDVLFKKADTDPTEYFTKEYKVAYGYLSIPIIVKGYLLQNNVNGLNIFAGPQVNFNLYADGKVDGEDLDLKDMTRGTTISVLLGVGYDFNCGFTVALSQELPLSSINKSDYSTAKLNTTSLGIGWRF